MQAIRRIIDPASMTPVETWVQRHSGDCRQSTDPRDI
jgi:hypothetical protein